MKSTEHPYRYPGTDIYRNKENIREAALLEKAERLLTANRLETIPKDIPISVEGYREIHRYMMQALYDWAGEYRYVTTGRGAVAFCKVEYIATEMNRRFAAIESDDNLRGLTPQEFADRSAEHICELNAIHPFLDGNGRTQRAFLERLALQAGHQIDLTRIDPDAWNDASKESFYTADYRKMRGIITDSLVEREPEHERNGVDEGKTREPALGNEPTTAEKDAKDWAHNASSAEMTDDKQARLGKLLGEIAPTIITAANSEPSQTPTTGRGRSRGR